MTQAKRAAPRKPQEAEIVPDMFGFHIRIVGSRSYIPKEYLLSVIEGLAYWLEPSAPDVKRFVIQLAGKHFIATEDLFPDNQDG